MSEGRKFHSWQGQDLSPEYDFTEPTSDVHVIWEEVEVGGRAWKGESDLGTVPLRDERGTTGNESNLPAGLTRVSLAAHNRWRWSERNGSNTVARGWIGPKDYMRDLEGGLRADRYREVRMSVLDANEQLKGIIVDANRPSETDTTRVEWVRSTYLAGSPDPTRNIASTYIASGSNTVTLPAQRVYGDPRSVLAEIASFANKEVFVTVDEELFYDGWDSTAYAAGLRISDRLSELNLTGGCAATEATFVDGGFVPNTGGNVTIPAGLDNSMLVVFAAGRSDTDPTATVTFGGTSLTAVPGSDVIAASWLAYTEAFYMLNPPAGTATLLATGAGAGGMWCGFMLLSGAEQAAPAATTNTATSATPNITIPTSGGALYLNSMFTWTNDVNPTADPVPAAGQTEAWARFENSGPGTGDREFGGGYGDSTPSWTLNSGSQPWVMVGLSVQGATAGSGDATFPPIWDVGPASTEDGQQLLSGLRMYYGAGSNTYVYVNSPITANQYGHYEESMYAPESVTTASAATTLANAVLDRRRYEDRNINVSIGPLTEDQIGCVKYGQRIDIKARAIAFADDQFFTGRIRQLRWTTPVPGMFFAHMQIERPIKDLPYGVGNRAGSEAVTSHVLQGSNAHPEFVLRSTLTTQGDLPYRGASDWTRLAIGASNTWLKSIGTIPKWETLPASSGGTITVKEVDGSPSVAADTIEFPNGTLTDLGGGDVRYTPAGGSSKYSADNTPTTTPAVSDEFDDGSLAAAWGWDSTPATVDESTYSGFLYIVGSKTERHLNRAWSPGAVDVTIAAKFSWSEPPAVEASEGLGIYVGDATGNPANSVLCQIQGAGAFAGYNENGAGAFSNLFTTTIGGMGDVIRPNFYLRLTRTVSGPTWRFYFSFDGLVWYESSTTGSKALTIASVGIRADSAGPWAVDWIRAWSSIVAKVGS